MTQITFSSERTAIREGQQAAEEWMKKNHNEDSVRQRLSVSLAAQAQEQKGLAVELEAAKEDDAAQQARFRAAYYSAYADRLCALTGKDLGMTDQPPKRAGLKIRDFARQFQIVWPGLTMAGVFLIGVYFTLPWWFVLILAGVGARVVAQRRGANAFFARAWGIVPTLPMLLGWFWIPGVAFVIHVWLWKHPDDRPPQQRGGGGNDMPQKV